MFMWSVFRAKIARAWKGDRTRGKNYTYLGKSLRIWRTPMIPLSNPLEISERIWWNLHVEFYWGRPWSGRGTQNPKWWFLIPNLIKFLIRVILKGDMTHCHISPTSLSYSIHIWTYISKQAGECSCNLSLDKILNIEDQPIKTNQPNVTVNKIKLVTTLALSNYAK